MIHILLHPLITLLYTSQQELFPECCRTHLSDISKHSVTIISVNSEIVQWFALEGTLSIIYFQARSCGRAPSTRTGSPKPYPTCP